MIQSETGGSGSGSGAGYVGGAGTPTETPLGEKFQWIKEHAVDFLKIVTAVSGIIGLLTGNWTLFLASLAGWMIYAVNHWNEVKGFFQDTVIPTVLYWVQYIQNSVANIWNGIVDTIAKIGEFFGLDMGGIKSTKIELWSTLDVAEGFNKSIDMAQKAINSLGYDGSFLDDLRVDTQNLGKEVVSFANSAGWHFENQYDRLTDSYNSQLYHNNEKQGDLVQYKDVAGKTATEWMYYVQDAFDARDMTEYNHRLDEYIAARNGITISFDDAVGSTVLSKLTGNDTEKTDSLKNSPILSSIGDWFNNTFKPKSNGTGGDTAGTAKDNIVGKQLKDKVVTPMVESLSEAEETVRKTMSDSVTTPMTDTIRANQPEMQSAMNDSMLSMRETVSGATGTAFAEPFAETLSGYSSEVSATAKSSFADPVLNSINEASESVREGVKSGYTDQVISAIDAAGELTGSAAQNAMVNPVVENLNGAESAVRTAAESSYVLPVTETLAGASDTIRNTAANSITDPVLNGIRSAADGVSSAVGNSVMNPITETIEGYKETVGETAEQSFCEPVRNAMNGMSSEIAGSVQNGVVNSTVGTIEAAETPVAQAAQNALINPVLTGLTEAGALTENAMLHSVTEPMQSAIEAAETDVRTATESVMTSAVSDAIRSSSGNIQSAVNSSIAEPITNAIAAHEQNVAGAAQSALCDTVTETIGNAANAVAESVQRSYTNEVTGAIESAQSSFAEAAGNAIVKPLTETMNGAGKMVAESAMSSVVSPIVETMNESGNTIRTAAEQGITTPIMESIGSALTGVSGIVGSAVTEPIISGISSAELAVSDSVRSAMINPVTDSIENAQGSVADTANRSFVDSVVETIDTAYNLVADAVENGIVRPITDALRNIFSAASGPFIGSASAETIAKADANRSGLSASGESAKAGSVSNVLTTWQNNPIVDAVERMNDHFVEFLSEPFKTGTPKAHSSGGGSGTGGYRSSYKNADYEPSEPTWLPFTPKEAPTPSAFDVTYDYYNSLMELTGQNEDLVRTIMSGGIADGRSIHSNAGTLSAETIAELRNGNWSPSDSQQQFADWLNALIDPDRCAVDALTNAASNINAFIKEPGTWPNQNLDSYLDLLYSNQSMIPMPEWMTNLFSYDWTSITGRHESLAMDYDGMDGTAQGLLQFLLKKQMEFNPNDTDIPAALSSAVSGAVTGESFAQTIVNAVKTASAVDKTTVDGMARDLKTIAGKNLTVNITPSTGLGKVVKRSVDLYEKTSG